MSTLSQRAREALLKGGRAALDRLLAERATERDADAEQRGRYALVIADLQRRNREYFEAIESMERQRDQWKEMFFDQSHKNQRAHVMLRRHIEDLSERLTRLGAFVNQLLKEAGLPQIATPADVRKLADAAAADYADAVAVLKKRAPAEDLDGNAARKRIAMGSEAPMKPGTYFQDGAYVDFGTDGWSLEEFRRQSGDPEVTEDEVRYACEADAGPYRAAWKRGDDEVEVEGAVAHTDVTQATGATADDVGDGGWR